MGIGEMADSVEITILSYYRDKNTHGTEAFWLWHGAEHRMADLIQEWGDVENWDHKVDDDGEVTVTNNDLGSVIKLIKRELQTGGSKS